jgi:nucleoside-diphosphate-sugar epimerase
MKILVTGATGFVGTALISCLSGKEGFEPLAAIRHAPSNLPAAIEQIQVGNLEADTDWQFALRDTYVVVHLAARAHVMNDSKTNALNEFRKVNVAGTLNLAQQAIKNGVQRFIFISSIGVNGAETFSQPFTENSDPHPHSAYTQSKWEAEMALEELARTSEMEMVIIRPPLVYGAGAPGNFGTLLRVVSKGIPLPLGTIRNQRSFVALGNLVDLIVTCIDHPAAGNQTFMTEDGEDLSTTMLLKRIGNMMNKPARLFPFPSSLINLVASVLGKKATAQSLCGSLQIDISKARSMLEWIPPISVEEGLRQAVTNMNK